ncbi:Scarecrow-like protein 8 [Glycine soja]|nr:Scarecrow-like protein 8 [Glycine soja]
MSMAGFELKPLSQSMAESIKSRLTTANNRVNSGLTVKEENGGICFGWMGRTLTVASAWR